MMAILKVDGEDMEGKEERRCGYLCIQIVGEVGTDVTLTIQRGSQEN